MRRMDTRLFRSTLETHGLSREVSDAIVDLVEDSKDDLVTGDKLELEMTKLRGEMSELRAELRGDMFELRAELRGDMFELRAELRGDMFELRAELRGDMSDLRNKTRLDMAGLRTEFAEHKTHMNRLVLGTSGALGLLMIMLRFLPA